MNSPFSVATASGILISVPVSSPANRIVSNTADKTVQSPGNGKIKNVSTDASGKGAVELWTDGDIMISVDGFNELWVEEGQPVSRGDTLGSGSDSLSIRVYKGGRPMEAEKLFDVDANIPA